MPESAPQGPSVRSARFGTGLGVLALMTSCAKMDAPGNTDRDHIVELQRVAEMRCDEPGGWTNLFFTGNATTREGAVAVFGEITPGEPIEVVQRRGGDGEIRYSLRVSGIPEENVLVFGPMPLGRCATVEVQLEGRVHPIRLQVATAEDYVYGRIAEYRLGHICDGSRRCTG